MNEELVKNGIFPMGEENPYGNFLLDNLTYKVLQNHQMKV